MRTRLTLRAASGLCCDVDVFAPAGTEFGSLRAELRRRVHPPGNSDSIWSGSRALPDSAQLGEPGLRSGCVIEMDGPWASDLLANSVLRLQVVCGPDAGMLVGLPRGLITLGRAPDCDVRLTDCDVSREHLTLTVTSRGVSVRDLNSTNGSWLLNDDGSPAEQLDADGAALDVGRYVHVGETVLCLSALSVPSAATFLSDDGALTVNRPPRLRNQLPPREISFDAELRGRDRLALPWLAALLPALAGAGLAWFMHSPQYLAYALLSPVLMLSMSIGERLTGRRASRRVHFQTRQRAVERSAELRRLVRDETSFRRSAHPDPATLLHTATTPDARIWERRREDADFLSVRLGLTNRPATLVVRHGNEPAPAPTLAAVPLTVDLRDGPLGICGPRPLALATARWAIGQIATLHTPTDVAIAALIPEGEGPAWNWMRWLPHADPDPTTNGPPRTLIAHTEERRLSLVAHLNTLVDQRGHRADQGGRRWSGPWLLLLIDRASHQNSLPGLVRILQIAKSVGVTAICIDDDGHRLPPACTSVAELTGESGSRVRLRTASDDDSGALAERVSQQWAEQVTRALCPLADPGRDASITLPGSVRLLDLIDCPLEPGEVRRRWSAGAASVRTVIGVAEGGPIEIDLERDGPHALIAGTTGAGKSELLQTLVAGLALNASPADLQFVLIDYKGGAAFADCARLPHASGLVTDLDGHLTERALRSLNAELTRRETLFATAAATDLAAYRRSIQQAADPLGRLVLVVDEFAALAEELPDFIAGLVDIAQRGRSLGLHLVLATQRPSGVVSPEIRANTALRISMRVTDPTESREVVGCDDAASIDKATPGRAVLRAGTALTMLQTARIGGFPPADRPPIEVIDLDSWGVPIGQHRSREVSGPTDLQHLVDSLRAAAASAGLAAARRPWLDALPDVVDIDSLGRGLLDPGQESGAADPFVISIGLSDRPHAQLQLPDRLDLSHGGSLLFSGGPRSGRSSALRTIAAQAALQLTAAQVHLHVIDCGGGALQSLAELRQCGSMLMRGDPVAIDRLLRRVCVEVARRQGLFAELGVGTAAEARRQGHDLAALVVLLDGWEGFVAATEDVDSGRAVETVLQLLRDATATGVTVVIAGDRATFATRLASAVQRRFVLRLADPDDYSVAGIGRRLVPGQMPPGRAVNCADGTELQLGVLGRDASTAGQLAQIQRIAKEASSSQLTSVASGPFVVRPLPARLRLADLGLVDDTDAAILGMGGDDGSIVAIAATGADARFLIAGPARSGRSTVLVSIASQLSGQGANVVVAANARSPLYSWAVRSGRVPITPAQTGPISAPLVAPPQLAPPPTLAPPTLAPLTPAPPSTGPPTPAPQIPGPPVATPPSPGSHLFDDPMRQGQPAAFSGQRPMVLLIDDCEQFLDQASGDALVALIRGAPTGLSAFASGRTDELAVSYRGIGAEMRRAQRGLLLQPGPGDGDLFGVRLPFGRVPTPPGRGYLVADDLIRPQPANLGGALPIQIALP